jgi:dihydroorotate dehydrogenase
MNLYKKMQPLLFKIDPENAHGMTLKALKAGLVPSGKPKHDTILKTMLWNRNFPNPVGLAAGFDKNAEIIAPMLKLGFGAVEVGTVTPLPQDGNPRPRVFRDLANQAVINRMGFPNGGLQVFKENIEHYLDKKQRLGGVVGINIGMNKDQSDPAKDYALLMQSLAPYADYVTINISSPNTPGLRDLQKRAPLLKLIKTVMDVRAHVCKYDPPPLLVKFAPDLDDAQLGELVGAVLDSGIDGVILTNTTLDRPPSLTPSFASEKGGLSGAPLKQKSTEIIRRFYKLSKGKVPLIGLGGIASGQDAYDKIKAGASLVQLYTSLVYEGPYVVQKINSELAALLRRDGFSHVSEAVGVEAR